jgi:hypothetical protein
MSLHKSFFGVRVKNKRRGRRRRKKGGPISDVSHLNIDSDNFWRVLVYSKFFGGIFILKTS